jgi:hypothetical protein
MAAIAVRTLAFSGDPAISVEESVVQHTATSAATLSAGSAVKLDTNGRWVAAIATGQVEGILTRSVVSGEAGTAIKLGVLDGFNLDAIAYGGLAYTGAAGALDTAGTVAVGKVIPGRSHLRGNAPDKLLFVNCTPIT